MVLHWRNSLCYRAQSRGKSAQKVSWTPKDPSTVALVGWKAVERRVCVGAEARRGGAQRNGVETALGLRWRLRDGDVRLREGSGRV